jgi:hypothetical protein
MNYSGPDFWVQATLAGAFLFIVSQRAGAADPIR